MEDDSMTPMKDDGAAKTIAERLASHRNALTLREVAKIFSISYATAFEMATRGRIPAFQIGSCWRLDPIELMRWLEEQRVGANARSVRPPLKDRESNIGNRPPEKLPPGHGRRLKHLERLAAELDIVDRRIARGESDKDRTERRRIARDEDRAERQRIARAEAADKRANDQSGKYTRGRGYRFWIPD